MLDTANVIICIMQPSHLEQTEKSPEILTCHTILKSEATAVN